VSGDLCHDRDGKTLSGGDRVGRDAV